MSIKPFATNKKVHLFNLSSNHSTSHLFLEQLCYQSTNHRVIRRAICLSIDTSNQSYISNICTRRPSFQPPKHLIILSSTKLPIQSVIRPSGISLSNHITTQATIHLFIQWASNHTVIHPTNQTAAIYKLIVHPFLLFSHPNILSSIHSQNYLSNQSIT